MIDLRMCPVLGGTHVLGQCVALGTRRILQFLELDTQHFIGAFCTGGTQS